VSREVFIEQLVTGDNYINFVGVGKHSSSGAGTNQMLVSFAFRNLYVAYKVKLEYKNTNDQNKI